MKIFYYICLALILFACCSNEGTTAEKIVDSGDTQWINFKDSLHKFYCHYSMIVGSPNSHERSNHEIYLCSLWDFFCQHKVKFVSFLMEVKKDESLYGNCFSDNLPAISMLPNNTHILFWIEALYRQDFLFGKRVRMGNSLTTYLCNPVLVFPYFITSCGDTIPKFRQVVSYDYDDMMQVRPNFKNDDYIDSIDSILIDYKNAFMQTQIVRPTSVDWFSLEGKFIDQKFEAAKILPDTLLR